MSALHSSELKLVNSTDLKPWLVDSRALRREARPEALVVVAHQGMVTSESEKGDVVANEHDVADSESLVDASGSVRHYQYLGAQRREEAHLQTHNGRCVPFVEVKATFGSNNPLPVEISEDELASVPRDSGAGKVRNLVERDVDCLLNNVCKSRKTAATNHGDVYP